MVNGISNQANTAQHSLEFFKSKTSFDFARTIKILPLGKKSLVDEKTLHLIFHESPMEDGALFGHN